ncbi:hypothetical protein M388_13195 [Mesotoga sp. Brook.08.YT.4.2.5.4.]|nr:hypothetical protein M388_13195 [Mesotoga sp. Brook.08.YT.4.2.5.4.]
MGVAGSVGKSKRTWRTVDGQRCFEQRSAGSPLLSVQRLFTAFSGQRKAGFLNETVAQLEISAEFGYLKDNQLDEIEEKAERMNRMLWKLSKSLETVFSVDGGPLTDNVVLSSVQRLFQRAAVLTELSVPIFASLVLQSVQQVFGTVFQRTRSRSVSYRDDSFVLLHVILARFRPGSRFLA